MGPERERAIFDMMEAELIILREENAELKTRLQTATTGAGRREDDSGLEAEIERLRTRVRTCEEELDVKHDLIESMEQQIEELGGGAP